MKTYSCNICGFTYNEEEGHPGSNIPQGTEWEKLPEEWSCPDCGVGKDDFTVMG